VENFPFKVYLTWREVLSGAIRVPRSLSREFDSREYQLVDDEDGKTYLVYYFPEGNYLLGLAEYFQTNNIPQGASLTLDKKGPDQLAFWIKKSKKRTATIVLDYDPESDRFSISLQEAFTLAMPNKSLYLEREVVEKLLQLYDDCGECDLRQLLIKILTKPELTGNSRALHFLRACHMADLIKATTPEDVEYVLNNGPEFVASEKKEGMFFYQEIKLAEAAEAEEEVRTETSLLQSLAEQLAAGEAERQESFEAPSTQQEQPSPKETAPAETEASDAGAVSEIKVRLEPLKKEKEKVKEKPARKKKAKVEEKGPKPRKSERRAIEEKIVEEESEIEALEALKAQEEEQEAGAEAQETIPVDVEVTKEEPKFGFFAEMLKSALGKKQPEEKEEKEEKK
jgi:hypothetical protein